MYIKVWTWYDMTKGLQVLALVHLGVDDKSAT